MAQSLLDDFEARLAVAMTEHATAYVRSLVDGFPNLRPPLDEHIKDNFGEILPHLFFGDVTNYVVELHRGSLAADARTAGRELRAILDTLEATYATGDEELQELISVSFLENLPRLPDPGSQIRQMLGPNLTRQLDVIG